jgi:hypothetical protein
VELNVIKASDADHSLDRVLCLSRTLTSQVLVKATNVAAEATLLDAFSLAAVALPICSNIGKASQAAPRRKKRKPPALAAAVLAKSILERATAFFNSFSEKASRLTQASRVFV